MKEGKHKRFFRPEIDSSGRTAQYSICSRAIFPAQARGEMIILGKSFSDSHVPVIPFFTPEYGYGAHCSRTNIHGGQYAAFH